MTILMIWFGNELKKIPQDRSAFLWTQISDMRSKTRIHENTELSGLGVLANKWMDRWWRSI